MNDDRGGVPHRAERFEIHRDEASATTVLHLVGAIDAEVMPQLVELAEELRGRHVVVDLSRVTFLDSSGLRALIVLNKRTDLALSAVSADAQRILTVTGLDGVFAKAVSPTSTTGEAERPR